MRAIPRRAMPWRAGDSATPTKIDLRTELGAARVDDPGVELSRRSASGNEGEGDDASPARRAAARDTAAPLVVEQTLVWATRNGAT